MRMSRILIGIDSTFQNLLAAVFDKWHFMDAGKNLVQHERIESEDVKKKTT